ncbi:MAG: DNA-binding IclR family transcriptional regulator [Verrucomicrobiales bacterium]|jgi:DNA-binding IclR family transcriptional regulator
MATSTTKSTTTEGPVDRAFRVLQEVVRAGEPLGVREIGRRTGLPRSTASRLIATLERLNMVARTSDGDVVPGSALETLHTDASSTTLLRDRLLPLLTELVATFGENAAMAVDDGDALLYVAQIASENPVSVSDVSGERQPFHLVAPGLLTMTFWEQHRLDDFFADPLLAATPHSMTSPTKLRSRLLSIRAQGYAWTDQELDVGINGLAVSVLSDGNLAATISLYGPSYRFSSDARPTLGDELRALVETRFGKE